MAEVVLFESYKAPHILLDKSWILIERLLDSGLIGDCKFSFLGVELVCRVNDCCL